MRAYEGQEMVDGMALVDKHRLLFASKESVDYANFKNNVQEKCPLTPHMN